MSGDDDVTIIKGSGNLFRDLVLPDPEFCQTKALLAAEIVKMLDERKLSARSAHGVAGVAAADFSRIRNVNLDRLFQSWTGSIVRCRCRCGHGRKQCNRWQCQHKISIHPAGTAATSDILREP